MQTRYNLYYRYVNETTNTIITNESDYVPTEIFYNEDHKLNITSERLEEYNNDNYDLKYKFDNIEEEEYVNQLIKESEKEKEAIISSNLSDSEKSNNLYVFDGTKKIFHEVFVPEALGYRVKNWEKVPKNQIPSGPDDYSKHFVMLGGQALGLDAAYLVCKPQYVDIYMNYIDPTDNKKEKKVFLAISTIDQNNYGYKKNKSLYGKHHVIKDINKIIDDEIMFEWYNPNKGLSSTYGEKTPSMLSKTQQSNSGETFLVLHEEHHSWTRTGSYSTASDTGQEYFYIFFEDHEDDTPIPSHWDVLQYTHSESSNQSGSSTMMNGWRLNDKINASNNTVEKYGVVGEDNFKNYAHTIIVDKENIMRDVIPEHYEATGKLPYYIKDCYKKVDMSPWILHSVHNSLEDGLETARRISNEIGIENVKLQKHVPLKQEINVK